MQISGTLQTWIRDFAELDHILLSQKEAHRLRRVSSDRQQALGTFLLQAAVDLRLERHTRRRQSARTDIQALQQDQMKEAFANKFVELSKRIDADSDLECLTQSICDGLHQAAAATLPAVKVAANRPWIRSSTLNLIERRSEARQLGHRAQELELNAQVKKAAKEDRKAWIDQLITNGTGRS